MGMSAMRAIAMILLVRIMSSICGSRARCRSRGSEPLAISGHGLRDHSWGPRYWQSIRSYRWITGNFGDDLGMVLSVVGDRQGGMFHRGDEFIRITNVNLETDYEPDSSFTVQ